MAVNVGSHNADQQAYIQTHSAEFGMTVEEFVSAQTASGLGIEPFVAAKQQAAAVHKLHAGGNSSSLFPSQGFV